MEEGWEDALARGPGRGGHLQSGSRIMPRGWATTMARSTGATSPSEPIARPRSRCSPKPSIERAWPGTHRPQILRMRLSATAV
jgi:hypothetical protein